MSKKAEDFKGLNLSNSGRAVWLVKVPKYMSSKWEQGNTDTFLFTKFSY